MNDLRDQLSDSARSFEVRGASPAGLYRRARHRQQRSLTVRAVAVALVLGAGVYGVDRLSGTRSGDLVSGSVPAAGPGEGESTVGSLPMATAASDLPGVGDDPLASLPQTRRAEFVAAEYDWTAYRADSPEALALRFDPRQRYAVSTSPANILQRSVYANTDGSWRPVVDLGSAEWYAVSPDTAYVVVTEGQDGNEEPTGMLRVIDLATSSETEVPFPLESGLGAAPTGRIRLHSWVQLSTRGGLLAALVNQSIEVDESVRLPGTWAIREITNGVVYASRACEDQPTGATSPPNGGSQTAANTTPPLSLDHMPTGNESECAAAFPVDELPLTADELALMDKAHKSLWTYDGSSWTSVALPDPTARYHLEDHAVLAHVFGDHAWRHSDRYLAVTNDGQLQPLFDGQIVADYRRYQPAYVDDGSANFTTVSGPYVFTQQIGNAEWHATDVRSLGIGTQDGPSIAELSGAVPHTDGGVIATGRSATDFPTEPMQLSSDNGEYSLTVGVDGSFEVRAAATGELIEDAALSTEPGRIQLSRSEVRGGFLRPGDPIATFSVDWASVPGLASRGHEALFVSEDGLRYRVIELNSILESTGLAAGSSQWSDPLNVEPDDVEVRDGRLIVRGSLNTNSSNTDSGTSVPYVFVGTPR